MVKKVKEEFKILSDIEHILKRPNMYVGGTSKETRSILVDHTFQNIPHVPGLFKIINEIIDNSVDEFIRTEGQFATKIDITMTDKSVTVKDNGRGIPVELITDPDGKKLFKPVAAWTRPRAGSNFTDDAERKTGGMNGVGSALTNIFSKKFIGETCDGKKSLTIVCSNNATIDSVKTKAGTKKGTSVTFEPDFERFEADHFDEHLFNMVRSRLTDISFAFPKIQFTFNGKKCSMTTKAYITKLNASAFYTDSKVSVAFMPSPTGEFAHYSIVNGLILYAGGSHIDYVMNQVVSDLREKLNKKYKLELTPARIRSGLAVVVAINGFTNLKVDAQTKEKVTNTTAEVATHLSHIDYESVCKLLLKDEAIIEPMISAFKKKMEDEDDAEAKKKAKELKGKKVAKHIPATSRIGEKKTLFIMEGDSAIGPFIEARNPETQGAIPLRGKIMNVFGEKASDIMASNELAELLTVTGLELGKRATVLNYGTIAITTDPDVDGSSIRGLLINFFHRWPELFEHGRIKIVHSPRYILRGKKDRKYFYSKAEWEAYKGPMAGYELVYIKGLGSLEIDEYKDMLDNPVFETVYIDDPKLIEMMYGPDVSQRKKYMMG